MKLLLSEKEAHAVFFDHEMHFVQQRRQALDLVDDHRLRLWRQRFPNQLGLAGEAHEQRPIEQVVGGQPRQLLAKERGLAD